MAKAVRMADIAEKLNVSVVTVSKALSGKDGVGSELREAIIKTADEMGYSTNKKNDSSNSDSLLIGILNAHRYLEKGSSFYWSLYEKLLKSFSSTGDLGVLEVVTEDAEKNLIVPNLVKSNRVDGIIAMGPFNDDYLKMLSELDVPVVLLDSYKSRLGFDSVISDGYYGMYIMTDYLIQQGHRDIMFVGTIGETSSITDRFFGYCRALIDAGIPIRDDMIIPDRNEVGKIEFDLPDDIAKRATALVCNCDNTAYEAINMLSERNIKVPDDISVVGFDNYILSWISPIKITTYEVNQDRMARESAKQIRNKIKNPNMPHDVRMVNGDIIIRDSVKKIQ